ncbi:MAG: TetR/AcrR family transcriptional regulator [Aureliella sp.]
MAKRASKAASTRQVILEAAEKLFLQDGYSQTSLDQVAQLAGTTKPTVYSHFGSKHGLFEAVAASNVNQRARLLAELLEVTDDPTKDLTRFGETFLARVLSKEARAWDRLAAAEAIAHPEVGETFYQAGPARVLAALSNYLKTQTRAGVLDVPDPKMAAEQLVGMLVTLDVLRAQIGKPPPTPAACRKRCAMAVQVFVKAYGRPNDE